MFKYFIWQTPILGDYYSKGIRIDVAPAYTTVAEPPLLLSEVA